MAISVNTSKQQITASVSEDKVTATVSAGFGATGPQGPQGPPGTTSWNSLTDKPATFPPESHTHGFIDNAGEITGSAVSDLTVLAPAIVTSGGSLRRGAFGTTVGTVCRGNDSRLSDARTPLAHVHSAGAITSGTFSPSRLPIAAAGALGAVRIGSGISIDPTTGVISVSGASVAWNDISGKPTFATVATSGSYTDLTNVPSTFAPSAHAASHAAGGADPVFDQDLNTVDSPEFAGVEFNAYTVGWKIEPRSSLGSAFDFKATLSGVTTTVFSVANNGVVGDCSIPWSLLTSIPSTFAPSAHKTSHATGNSDALSPSDIGAASASHAHSAADVTSGVFDVALLPVGTGSTQVAAGNHTHTQLHDRSHAITSTSDHTAGNWKVLYTNGSGQVVELGLGDSGKALISNGASAAPSWGQAGSNSASDLTTGTLSDSRLSTNAQAAINLYLWSSFR